MTRPQQKLTEQRIVEEYLRARGRSGEIENGDEPPDFWVTLSSGPTIAVEVLEYHQPWTTGDGHTPRQVEVAWEEIRCYVVEYRKSHDSLNNLSVRLEFTTLKVPSRTATPLFVRAVHEKIGSAAVSLGAEDVNMPMSSADESILREHLKAIHVRRVGCYMEWDWNHCVGGVGTNDIELFGIVAPKLSAEWPVSKDYESHLVIAGSGPGISQVMAPWSEEQLNTFARLNRALQQGPFAEVAILSLDYFLWRRGHKWQHL